MVIRFMRKRIITIFFICAKKRVQKSGDPQQPMEKVDPGNLYTRWVPYEKAHELYQGQLPWRSLRSQDMLFPVEKRRTPCLL